MIHHALPPNAVADWDSTVVVRYGSQEDAAAPDRANCRDGGYALGPKATIREFPLA